MPPVTARRGTGWIIRPFFRRRHQATRTNQDIDEELWLTLRHPAEVADAGTRLLERHRPGHVAGQADEMLLREFRAYLRQAENFYRGAKVLPWNSSPLNYYYSFLNLAKAYCLISDALGPAPPSEPRRIRHGIFERVTSGTSGTWQLTTGAATEMFPLLYNQSIGTSITPGVALEAHDLLGYSVPIGWQLAESGHRARILSFPCKWAICTDAAGAWDILGVPSEAPRDLLGAAFYAAYEEIEFESIKDFALTVWRISAFESSCYTFFQAQHVEPVLTPGNWNLRPLQTRLEQSLPHAVFEHLDNNDFQLLLCLGCPVIGGAARVPMNEAVATYAVMFFLSSLVRYHPEYMDQIAHSSDAWLIESFVKSAPLGLLRCLTAKILGYTMVMESA